MCVWQVSLAKLITPGQPIIETVILAILCLIGLIPLAVIRSASTDVIYFFGLLGTGVRTDRLQALMQVEGLVSSSEVCRVFSLLLQCNTVRL